MKKTLAAVALSAALPVSMLSGAAQAADTYPSAPPSSAAVTVPSSASAGEPLEFGVTINGGSNVPSKRQAPAPLSKQRGVMKVVVKIGPEGRLKQRFAFTRIARVGAKSSFATGKLKYKGTYRVIVLFRPYNPDVVGKSRTVKKVRVR